MFSISTKMLIFDLLVDDVPGGCATGSWLEETLESDSRTRLGLPLQFALRGSRPGSARG